MKKSIKALFAIALAITALVSCAKELQAPVEASEELIEVTLIAGNPEVKPATKTEMDGTTPKWSASDSIGVSTGTSGNYRFDTDIVAAAVTASFSGSSVSGDLYAYHPYGKDGVKTANGATGARVNLIKDQYPTATSFDGNADLMVSKQFTVSPANTTVSGLQFARLGAIVKIVLIDSEDTMSGTQYPSSVSMTAESALAGYVIIDMENQSMTDPYYNTSNTVTANYTNETHFAINGTNGAYLIVAPQTLAEGSSLTIAASTDGYSISKTISVPTGGIELLPGKVNTLNISLAAGHITPKSTPYELYSGGISEGDYLIVYDGVAMKAVVESDRLQYTAISATDNKIFNPDDDCIWHIAQSGEYWTIYNADSDTYAASTGAKSKAQLLDDGTDDKSKWTITGSSTYEIVNKANTSASVNANLRRNGTYGFACYGTGTGGALSLYKLNDGKSDAEISYARSSDEITEGDALTPPALSNTHGLAITCSSDNASVATVNATTGAITVEGGVGTAVITVSWVEQTISTVTYRAGSTTYTLTINAADANDGSLSKPYTATEAAALAIGGNTNSYYITGYITNIPYQFDQAHGTSSFWIHDTADGATQTFEGYGVKYFNNVAWLEGNGTLSVGDKVLFYGQLKYFNSTTPETNGGNLVRVNDNPGLTVPTLTATPNDANKQIAVTWGEATGAAGTITYTVTCGAQEYVATAAGSHTFTMANYGNYDVKVVCTADNVWNSIAATSATLTDPGAQTHYYNKVNSITVNKKYLIVGGGGDRVLIPSTGSNKKSSAQVTVDTENNRITSTAVIDGYAVTIIANSNNSDYYDITFVSSNTTYYLQYAGSSTNLSAGTSSSSTLTWDVVAGTHGTFRFKDVSTASASTKRGLIFRGSTYNQFGGYSLSNPNGTEYYDIDLYEYDN